MGHEAVRLKCGMRRLLIIGCGDVAMRMVPLVRGRYASMRSRASASGCRPARAGFEAAVGRSRPAAIRWPRSRVSRTTSCTSRRRRATVLRDTRTAHLIAALAKGKSLPQHLVYISTSGVYGDCGGELVDETRPLKPQTARAKRRVDAERQLREWGARSGVRVTILRAPGIYAADRLPLARLTRGDARAQRRGRHVRESRACRRPRAHRRRRVAARTARTAATTRPTTRRSAWAIISTSSPTRFGLPRPPRIAREEARSDACRRSSIPS